jgi:hypothetical protein
MQDDQTIMKQPVNKFVIRQSIKELQAQRVFESLDDLTQAVTADLFSEGFSPDAEDKAKIARIVNDEGYTGRFAIDDLLRRKLKHKRWLPLASVLLAGLAFFVTTSAGAVIEHYVQKPLDNSRAAAPFTAVFQVPETTGGLLRFKVKLTNISAEPLSQMVLFACAGEVTQQFKVDPLEAGQSKTVTGALAVAGMPEGEVDFVAYVISGDFSLCSEPTTVAYRSREVAMTSGRARTQQTSPSGPTAGIRAGRTMESAANTSAKASAALPAATASPAASALSAEPQEAPLRTVPPRQLSSQSEVQRLAAATDPTSRRLLEAYAAAGDQQAIELLSGHP